MKDLSLKPDSIDHQCVALVMADRLAVPGRLQIAGMRHIEIHVAHLLVTRKDHHNYLGVWTKEIGWKPYR